MPKLLPALLLLTLSCASPASERALRFAINDSWAMPMVRIEDGKAVEGILVDLQQRMAAKVGRKAELLVMPRMRVQHALDSGDIDVRCYVSPHWINSGHYRYIWSLPFMTQRDVLAGINPEQLQPEQLLNERLGTVLGFAYPRLEPLFASKQIQREDARTQDQVLLKLSARRYRYAISNELSLHWFNRHQPPGQKLHLLSEVASDPIACIVRDATDIPTMALLRAMVQMKQAGEFDDILARYR
ncbi:MAG: ABC transporter substrate-binding protein [Pseudomonas sp.]|uniref:substrate-binding periplasmic protein n=1 Tax=Pseudomonas sp. TaxID=306 RepID=UPI00271B0F41|nr:ABC transporter substrate-binding protein [Pseudomonas sp.]MDO9618003.1 ABC transporter substrate-binding protein [Pseudomonas sp.]MDP2445487.1 ABC transporter substrate-binding protein [Pseudomonas sp.]MDZ4332292.1 ABC transporter substrate-binding protein [Pseudomonas sp.]